MKSLDDAIKAGKALYLDDRVNPGKIHSEDFWIRLCVGDFIWASFKGKDLEDPVQVLDTIKRITY